MIFIFLYDHKLKSGANKKIQAFMRFVTENKMDYWASSINLEINYKGGDLFLIYNGKMTKVPSRALKRILQLLIERLVRWIFSPQSKGFLSANSMYLLSQKNNES